MSRPRMPRAFSSASAGSAASFTPPAFPRPPVSTCAFTTTGPPSDDAAARASSGETASRPSETGIPTRRKSSLPWYSYRSTAADNNDPVQPGCAPPRLASIDGVDAIVTEELRKRYKNVQALDGVSFAVREGEVFGLLGPNGAGKSTTVRTLATLTQPDSGRAFVAGEDVVRHPNRVRRSIGYAPRTRASTGRPQVARTSSCKGASTAWPGRPCAGASTSCSSSSGCATLPTGSLAATPAG